MKKFLLGVFFLCLMLSLYGCGKTEPIATLKKLHGGISIRESDSSPFKPAGDHELLPDKSAVRTGDDGQATLLFLGKGELSLDRNTFFEVRKGENLGHQSSGKITYKIDKQGGKTVSVETPMGLTTVMGTIFTLKVNPEGTTLIVEEGKVGFSPKAGGEQKVVTAGNQLTTDSAGKIKDISPLPQLNPGLVHPK